MRGGALGLIVVALAACTGEQGAAQPEDDPDRGIYNYDHARELGIRVDPVPPADQLCPTDLEDDGLAGDELDTPEERAEVERQMAEAPTCIVDPRLAIIVIGYSIEAVHDAPTAFDKGS